MAMNCAPGNFPYIIKPGDTYWGMAGLYDTTVDAIMAANPGVDPNNLLVGQVICLPGDPPSFRGPDFHRRFRDEFERRRREEERRRMEEERRRREEERRRREFERMHPHRPY
ncbi:MAG TPA: LysM domain-containing protein [Bacillota bacterium]|nr:LysM domain-containing protein [Bacillota bacterium]